jgi:hypothetical protein
MVSRSPFGWVEAKAWSIVDLWDSISKNHPEDHPVSYFIIAVIFFEETGFCNTTQAFTKGTLGVGFGQLEVRNPEKKEFYEWAGLSTDYLDISAMMQADNDTSVSIHCQWFQYLTSVKGMGLDGCLGAQVGGHTAYKKLFLDGAKMFEDAYNNNDRDGCQQALNHARYKSPKKNGIPADLYGDYWDLVLPGAWCTPDY